MPASWLFFLKESDIRGSQREFSPRIYKFASLNAIDTTIAATMDAAVSGDRVIVGDPGRLNPEICSTVISYCSSKVELPDDSVSARLLITQKHKKVSSRED